MSANEKTELQNTMTGVKHYFVYAGIFSAGVNLLMLVPIVYMLQIYDRVITSGSLSTLVMLTLLMVVLLCAMGGLEWVRSLIMVRASNKIEKDLRDRVSTATFSRALLTGGANASAQPYYDLSSLRQFMTGNALFAFFDAPWFPIYVAIMFLFHPWFGVAALVGGAIMLTLAVINDRVTSKKIQDANAGSSNALIQIGDGLRNAEAVAAMGMTNQIRNRQEQALDAALSLQTEASEQGGLWGSLSKTIRIIMQSLVLGLGAYLALNQQISPGMMIAGSLLLGRALAPIDLLVNAWKGFSVAKAQFQRLSTLLENFPEPPETLELPAPKGDVSLENVIVVAPGEKAPLLTGINLEFCAGEAIGIVGPSAAGKSSLVRTLLGIWPVAAGTVRLDGADIRQWERGVLGNYLGYLPQDIELFDGTVSENICRFGELDPRKIVEAARLAGVHQLILRLPDGYDTVIGGGGATLSGGQRQSVALARAVYGNPRLVVLDEPNSNLDDQGERELTHAIARIRATGATIVIVTHRTSVLSAVDKILVLKDGKTVGFGPRTQMLSQLTAVPAARPTSRIGQ